MGVDRQPIDWTVLTAATPLLAALPGAARRGARLETLARTAVLFRRGDRPVAMYCVIRGEVHLVRHSVTGAALVVQRVGTGFVAEASWNQHSYHCDALAVVPSLVLVLPRRAFADALAEEVFRSGWIAHLSRELRRVRAQAERLSLRSAEERVVHCIETDGEDGVLHLATSRKEWAAELGLTHEALYRALARMRRAGTIRIEASAVTLLGAAAASRAGREA